VLVTVTSTTSFAQGEHGRRAAAELRVALGDVDTLFAIQNKPSDRLIKKGLRERIRGSLAGLDILFRLADQEAGRPPRTYTAFVMSCYEYLKTDRLQQLSALLGEYRERFLLVQIDDPLSLSSEEVGRELHQSLCAACHDNPATDVERPAYNLYEQASLVSADEFFARMLVGVRGDRVTGIDNPLTDFQIISLIRLYNTN